MAQQNGYKNTTISLMACQSQSLYLSYLYSVPSTNQQAKHLPKYRHQNPSPYPHHDPRVHLRKHHEAS